MSPPPSGKISAGVDGGVSGGSKRAQTWKRGPPSAPAEMQENLKILEKNPQSQVVLDKLRTHIKYNEV